MSLVVTLPRDLLFLIVNYLLPKDEQNKLIFRYSHDWRNFVNTSKEYFSEWKKQTQVVVLESEYALKFIRSPEFSHRVIQLMDDSLYQLELHATRTEFGEQELRCIDRVKCFSAYLCTINSFPQRVSHLSLDRCDIPQPPSDLVVSQLHLRNCFRGPNDEDGIVDVRAWAIVEDASFWSMDLLHYECLSSSLTSVSIQFCDSITDVSCFRNIQKVKFTSCHNITDVSCLGDVRELIICCCSGITDVSSLGRVYNLELSSCKNITDVSALGNVKILNLNECRGVRDITALKNVSELHLEEFHPGLMEDEEFRGLNLVGFGNVEKLFLNQSHIMNNDISMLTAVTELHVDFCPKITNFHGLSNLKVLEAGHGSYSAVPMKITSGLEIFENLVEFRGIYVEFLDDSQCSKNQDRLLSFSDFPNVQTLILKGCFFSHLPTILTHLHSLSLDYCRGFSLLPLLPSLNSLTIFSCTELTELRLSGNGETFPICKVRITCCSRLKELRISRKISQLKIFKCPELSRLIIESQINFLRIKNCPALKDISSSAPIIIFSQGTEPVYEEHIFSDGYMEF
jgi:hypothetical protein